MIHLIATGGTIAGEADPESGGARYRAGVRPVGALLDAVPGLAPFALSAEQVLALDSKDMTPEDWLTVLAAVRRALANPAVDGTVILHGTDTLEETAYFLQLTLPAGKPVVLDTNGYHVMLMGLVKQVKEGDTVPLTLIVEDSKGQKESIKVDAPVRSLTATDGHGEHSMHDHSHM